MDKLRFGIVGMGKQGTLYASLLTKAGGLVKDAVLAAVCDVSGERRRYAEERLRGVRVFDSYPEMFASGLIDAVMIETPHYLHPEIAVAAFRAGLHVLCDKPAGVHVAQARLMNEEAERHPELVFGMMFNQRTNPLYIRAKRIIESGELGRLKRIVWIITDWYRPGAYYAQGGWRGTWRGEGGGVLINQCPHQLDLFTWLAGLPESVIATTATVGRRISVENDVTAICKYPGGATGVFVTSTHDAPGTNRLELSGDGGKIVIEKGKLTFTRNAQPEPAFSEANEAFMARPRTRKTVYRGIGRHLRFRKYPPQHLGVMKSFTDAVLGRGGDFIAPGREGIVGLSLSNAIHLSGWTGREVRVPPDEAEFQAELERRKAEEEAGGAK